MIGAGIRDAASRRVVVYLLTIIALIIVISVTILVLVAHGQRALLRSAHVASDYHLASALHARKIEGYLWAADRRVARKSVSTQPTRDLSALRRIVYQIKDEMEAIESRHRTHARAEFNEPLRRLLDQSDRLEREVSTLTDDASEEASALLARLDHFRLRLEQFGLLHWIAYRSQDTPAAHNAWRRSLTVSIVISAAGLSLIGITARQIVTAVRDGRRAARRQRLLQAELDHRVKNNLAAVLALAHETISSSADLDEFGASFTARIVAMARLHEALAEARWVEVDLTRLASLALAPYRGAAHSRITTEGDSVLVPAKAAMPLCLILHELCTNAARHGALSAAGGEVSFSWANDGGGVDLSWVERGGPVVIEPKAAGLGLQLIDGFARHQLGGDLDIDFRPEGLTCRMSIPLDAR